VAHVGVIKALTEAGIPIDVIGGASGGAVIAAQYALGWDHDTMLRRTKALMGKGTRVRDYTIPLVSLFATRRFLDVLHDMFGDIQIEDLWLGCYSVSANLTNASVFVHRQGSLRRSLRASTSCPGVCPPVIMDGNLLVDGGVLKNLPTDIMRDMCEGGAVVGVDVSVKADLHAPYRYGDSLSASQLFWNRINPFAAEKLVAPDIVTVLLRSQEVGSVFNQNELVRAATLYLNPPVARFGMFDQESFDELVEIGYEYTRARVTEWKAAERDWLELEAS
jgi:predicted acylesterase/phospholipase RssA